MSNKQQTAVDWFMEQIGEKQPNGFYVISTLEDVQNVFQQAKEMDKQQKIEFAKRCLDKALDLDVRTAYSKIEQYYNETFGGKDEQ